MGAEKASRHGKKLEIFHCFKPGIGVITVSTADSNIPRTHLCSLVEIRGNYCVPTPRQLRCRTPNLLLIGYRRRAPTSNTIRVLRISPTKQLHCGTGNRKKGETAWGLFPIHIMQACDRCYRRKSKCDKAVPTCGQCQKARTPCDYIDRTREPTVRREAVERLERRLRQTEAKNRALASQLATYQVSRSNSIGIESREGPRPSALSPNFPFDRNEVADEVSFLSLQAGGERNYPGAASGVVFANLIQGVASLDSSGSHAQSTNRTPSRQVNQTASSISISREALPPEIVARRLHQAYFKHDYLCYPFLNRRSVLANLDRIYADVSVLEGDATVAFPFYMVLAIAMASAHKCDWQSLPESENFQARAMARVTEVLQRSDIHAIQAVLLLSQYRMTSPIQEKSTSLWHMVGFAARMCFEQGLHRNETYYDQSGHPDNEDLLSLSETRRRCFWCVVDMDR